MYKADVAVVGGGHNGLICAAYLAKSGINTILLEARSSVGGCASTVSDLGARFNICSCEHGLVRAMPIIEELELAKYGLSYVEPEASSVFAFYDDSEPWVIFSDVDKTLEGLSQSYPSQVEGYRRYLKDSIPIAMVALEMAATVPSATRFTKTLIRQKGKGIIQLLEWSRSSATEILSRYFDDWHMIMPAISVGPTVWGLAPDTPGTGLAALGYATRHVNRTGRPVGGSGSFTEAVKAAFEADGGKVICGAKVEQLFTDNNGVKGVRLENGDTVSTQIVVAACDPNRVFSDWVSEPPKKAQKMVKKWQNMPPQEGYQSKIDGVLGDLPEPWWGAKIRQNYDGLDPLGQTTILSPSPQDLAKAQELRFSGRVAPNPTMLFDVPSVPDPQMRTSAGKHILSLEVLFTPYSLEGGWSSSQEPQRWLDLWASLMEVGANEMLEDWRVVTPETYEKEFSMHKGHTPAFGGSPVGAFLGRPRELTRYKTDIEGLFLSGAATYPGAGIIGSSGRSCAYMVNSLLKSDLVRSK